MKKNIAVVTGASSGIGLDFALQIDKKYDLDEIWLIARRKNRLVKLAGKLKKSKGIPIQADLSKSDSLNKLASLFKKQNVSIKILVNNAGYSKKGEFTDLSNENLRGIMDVNIFSLTVLTYYAIPYMPNDSIIFMLSSVLGFSPTPFAALYSATKTFILSFSNSLNYELKKNNIHVIAVCPGPVKTEFVEISSNGKLKQLSKGYSSTDVVANGLHDADKKKMFSIHGFKIKSIFQITRIFSRKLMMALSVKIRRSRQYKK
ncbi:MAG: SDR family NAD(P)-dependent oxidoreductase [Spirochaetes bacterium]|nr:SDR family NAD(P)-dependent oxidoreductase [Spirochaetota bacterium]